MNNEQQQADPIAAIINLLVSRIERLAGLNAAATIRIRELEAQIADNLSEETTDE